MQRIALITGANRGIGKAIAQGLAQQGLFVVLGAREPKSAEPLAAEIRSQGGQADLQALDVTLPSQRQEAIQSILQRHGRLDVLINNAGVALDKWVRTADLELDILRQTMETNVYAPLHLCQLALPAMQAQAYGRIVNMSSELGSLEQCQMGSTAAYRSSKTALNMLTRLLACELKDQPDILVNAAAPGWVRTELGGEDAPLSPEQGADTALWLATLPAGGPSGGFFRERSPYPW
ncbi:MAG: SDR family oxidoreductase [Oceanococcaceae bacterium]